MIAPAAAATLVLVALPLLRGTDLAPPAPMAAAPGGGIQPSGLASAAALQPGKARPARSPQLEAYFRAHRELAATGVMPSAVAYIRNSGEPDR